MSKLKIIDMNKQLIDKSKQTVARMEALQSTVQAHLATLKRIEAELLQIVRAEAEEKRLREQQEEQRAAAEARAAEEAKAAQSTQAAEAQPAQQVAPPAASDKGKAPEEAPAAAVPTETRPAEQPVAAQESAPKHETVAEASAPTETVQQAPSTTQDIRAARQEARPQKPERPAAHDSRPPKQAHTAGQDSRPRADAKPAPGKKTPGVKPVAVEIPFMSTEKRGGSNKKSQDNFLKEEKAPKKSKKALIKERIVMDDDERYRAKRRPKANKPVVQPTPVVIDKVVMTTEMISVKTLAEKTGKPVAEILKKLLLLGMMCTINSEIDYDTAQLICNEFGIELEYKPEKTAEDVLDEGDQPDAEEDLVPRPPIVTVMGHVDHGKTSLLDAIRQTKVTEHEAGGITQHIGAYTVMHNGRQITFLDTPGHEAFTAMRARGAQVTDIAILVVAADDGVMPQTIEAINHAKAANVPIIVAINKIDKPTDNPERIKQELTEHGLLAEEWGGDTIMVPVSAITKEGLDNLLEMILLVADILELKANPNRLAKGTIIEAKLDKGRGPVATVLVQNGTLRVSDTIVAGVAYGRVRAMSDDRGNRVEAAYPSQPVEVVGFSEVPVAGDILHAVEQDKLSRLVAEERKDKQKAEQLKSLSRVSFEDLFDQVEQGKVKDLNIVVKADVQGSVEAVKQALEKLSNNEVRVKVIHAGVGAIKVMDVMLAAASNAVIIGFNVRPDSLARAEAEKEKVEIRTYRVIYKAIEDLELAIKGMLAPQFKEVILGHAEVRNIFVVSSVGTIAGSYVTDGKIARNASVRLLRDNVVVHEGQIASLKRFKDDVKEVVAGYECGITIKNYNDIKEGDVIEAFEMQEIER